MSIIQTQDFKYPCKVLAHRGGGIFAPENTLGALQTCLDFGFNGVEFDVMLTKDSRLVLMHDCTPGRTIANYFDRTKYTFISEGLNYQEIISMEVIHIPHPHAKRNFNGEKVPCFEKVVQFCVENRIWMNVEIKPCPGYEHLTGTVIGDFFHNLIIKGILTEDQYPLFSLAAVRHRCPLIPRALLLSGSIPLAWQEQLASIDAVCLHVDYKHLTSELAAQIKSAGYGLFCYTVNDVGIARELLSWGVDAMCTDRLDTVRQHELENYAIPAVTTTITGHVY